MSEKKDRRKRSPSIITLSSDSSRFSTPSPGPSKARQPTPTENGGDGDDDGDLINAIDHTIHKEAFESAPNCDKPYFIEDIAEENSDIPVQVLNAIDDMDYGSEVFVYSASNVYRGGVSDTTSLPFCKCKGRCRPRTCSCIKASSIKLHNGKIDPCQEKVDFYEHVLYECCEDCACKGQCRNTFSTKSMPYRYQLFRRRNVGFGCRTLDDIKKGSFVCEFIGEVMPKRMATERSIQSFMYTSHHHPTNSDLDTVVDPYFYGNCSRFFNHSCNENLLPFRFFRELRQRNRPHIGFFAKHDIERNTELTIDYGTDWWEMNVRNRTIEYCCCDAEFCVSPTPDRRQISEKEMEAGNERLEEELKWLRKHLAQLKMKLRKKRAAEKAKNNAEKERSKKATMTGPLRRSSRNADKNLQ